MVKVPPLVLCHLTPFLRGTCTLELLILVNLVNGLIHTWHKQGYDVERHPEAMHQDLLGVPCGQLCESDGYIQPCWKWMAKSFRSLGALHWLSEELWRQSDKISVTI